MSDVLQTMQWFTCLLAASLAAFCVDPAAGEGIKFPELVPELNNGEVESSAAVFTGRGSQVSRD